MKKIKKYLKHHWALCSHSTYGRCNLALRCTKIIDNSSLYVIDSTPKEYTRASIYVFNYGLEIWLRLEFNNKYANNSFRIKSLILL